MFEKMRNKFRAANRAERPKNMAVFVDGPNILRKEFNIDLSQVKRSISKFGKIKIGRVFFEPVCLKQACRSRCESGL